MSTPAANYETFMVPTLFRPWAKRLIEFARPQAGERVLDLACGTGIVARCVAPTVGSDGSVSGLDFSQEMLDVAREAASREHLSIEWRSGRAEELPYDDEQFDLVLCQFALMFFSDRKAALSEVNRVLANDGRLALSVFQDIRLHPFYQTLDKAIERRLGTSGIADIFALGDAEMLRSMLEEAGFHQIDIESLLHASLFPNPEGFLAGEIDVDTASIPAMQSLDANEREALTRALHDEMEGPLRNVTNNGQVEMPFHVHFAMARKST